MNEPIRRVNPFLYADKLKEIGPDAEFVEVRVSEGESSEGFFHRGEIWMLDCLPMTERERENNRKIRE